LNNSIEIKYQIRYSGGGFTIEEQLRNCTENTSQSRWLYCQDGDRVKFNNGEGVYKSYDDTYAFKEDGCYEYYFSRQNYLLDIPIQEGPYEIISADEIRIYEDYSRLAYTEKKFDSDRHLISGSDIVFKK